MMSLVEQKLSVKMPSKEPVNLGVAQNYLTAVFFETGAMLTPTKSENGTNCGSGGLFQSYLTHS